MPNLLSVIHPFTYEKGNNGCSCHEYITFEQGDFLWILDDPFYVDQVGWYIAVQKNDKSPFYMSIPFIDEKYEDRSLFTEMDRELAINIHQFQIDQSLISKDKAAFLYHTEELDKLMAITPDNMYAQ
ncbi:hypothetical protein SAMN05192559_10140 [Halobacillus karajensis]|uniref:Uncharacterized protein n=1 Tax=Halobacillus karajensis TaxID=195088 RepID=A0A059NW50_9BACI|nr:hypothetical protein [Halobacillus karajensis]CDQ19307.1 hypothetical protein BN982_01594 [Halobacillus karajensis]CDQ22530.1 hypothetical protein BN983_00743 [Halobacillus karajensis]CDQ26012.1 hypothetical protein BN981_00223 [Halobacillus karajensis]SEH38545.1 hypothetical protein SAMN05192559_10140 [Halobacillus karajensis]